MSMPSHHRIAIMAIKGFVDGRLEESELDALIDIALEDQKIDADEQRVLASIFRKLGQRDLTPAVKAKVQAAIRRFAK